MEKDVRELLDKYKNALEAKNYSPETVRNYVYFAKDFAESGYPLTPQGLVSYLDDKSNEWNKNTVIVRYQILKQFLETACGFGKSDFPASRWRKAVRLPVFLTEKEAKALLKKAKNNPTHYAMISFMLNTGVRVSELVNIKVEDISVEEEGITVRILGKGDKERIVPISQKLYELLRKVVIRNRTSGYLFTTHDKPYNRSWVYTFVSRYGRLANIKKRVSPHVLRHTFATIALNNNILTVPQIQKVLGHSNLRTTMIYATVTMKEIRKAIDKFSEAILE